MFVLFCHLVTILLFCSSLTVLFYSLFIDVMFLYLLDNVPPLFFFFSFHNSVFQPVPIFQAFHVG